MPIVFAGLANIFKKIMNIEKFSKQNIFMRTSTKVWLIIAIITNIAMLYFFEPMINALTYVDGSVHLTANWEAYFGLALFLLANISGFIVFARFIKAQTFSRQIFFTTLLPTITFVSLMFFFFNITTMEQIGIVAMVRDGLSINSATSRYIWMAVVAVIYAVYLLITYFFLTKPIRRLEKALEIIKFGGEPKKSLELGGSKEFRAIEADLRKINLEMKDKRPKEKVVEE